MLLLTHDIRQENKAITAVSRLSIPSSGKQHLVDFVSSNIPSDEYFTHSHQSLLYQFLSVGSATISAMWHDEELFPNCLGWYVAFLNFISNEINLSNELGDDIALLHIMLQPVIFSDDENKRDLSPLCYGAGMFICALIEKLLRSVYIWLQKDHMYVPISSATIGSLLSPDNKDMENIFGRDHLMNLSFFLSTVGEKKIGLNIRNSLAHWTELDSRNLNSMMVARLMYLYTDIINTLFWYFVILKRMNWVRRLVLAIVDTIMNFIISENKNNEFQKSLRNRKNDFSLDFRHPLWYACVPQRRCNQWHN